MTSPAQQAGIIENGARLIINNDRANGYIWILADDDNSPNPFFRSECGTFSRRCFAISDCEIIKEPVLELPPPPVISVNFLKDVPVYSVWQKRAINCFQKMHDDAVIYHNGGSTGGLRVSSGICDNITLYTDFDDSMSRVKDNLIRTLPSYSGEYHYPVKGTDEYSSAERAWDNIHDKWMCEYGASRLAQLGELIEAIKTRWDESLITQQSPAQRMGLKIGDLVWHRERGELLTFAKDDNSSDPYFTRHNGDRMSTHLDYIERDIAGVLTGEPIEVLIGRAKSIIEQREALRLQVVEIEQQMNQLLKDVASIDVELAHTHGVKRINS